MNTTIIQNMGNEAMDGRERPSSLIRRWGLFLFGVLLLWSFVFVIAPWIQESPQIKPLAEFIERTGIDASALYYTEVDETGEAEVNIRSSLEYR